ncbi:MAG: cupin domain-containing protein [Gammaproteobacteria bacterium]
MTESPALLEGLACLRELHSQGAVAKRPGDYRAYRISPDDSNRLVIVFDPAGDDTPFISCVEIFDEGGRTPPNVHRLAYESFFVLRGQARATCDGSAVDLGPGDSLLVPPGGFHLIENIGAGRLYMLTTMVPDEDFSALIRRGTPVSLDAEDLAVLAG